MKEKIKEYCELEIHNVERYGYNAREACTRCYGAVMFLLYADDYDENLATWWDNEMHPRFHELMMKGVLK